MKIGIPLVICLMLLGACSDSSDRSSAMVQPPTNPPVDPPPPEPPAMQSFADFARTTFADPANSTPREVQGLQFAQDAQDDDFADLLQ